MMMIYFKIHILFRYQFRHKLALFWYKTQFKEQGQEENRQFHQKQRWRSHSSHSLDRHFYKTRTFELSKNCFKPFSIKFLISSSSSGNSEILLKLKQKF